ncbi:hypothetical protein DL317_06235 [Limosilactobacillus reuteri]|nr:hypothetical protein DL317_06235 [Limosilactobacillus reuteri]
MDNFINRCESGDNLGKTLLITCPQIMNLHNAVDYFADFVNNQKNLNKNSPFINFGKCVILPKYV